MEDLLDQYSRQSGADGQAEVRTKHSESNAPHLAYYLEKSATKRDILHECEGGAKTVTRPTIREKLRAKKRKFWDEELSERGSDVSTNSNMSVDNNNMTE